MRYHPCLLLLGATVALGGCAGGDCGSFRQPPLTVAESLLLQPSAPSFHAVPPDTFEVELTTSAGPLTIQVIRAWAPIAAARFYNLARNGFYDGSPFFRVVPGFIAQFGVNGHPAVDAAWAEQKLPDDPPLVSNLQGTVAFAMAGPGSRVSQVFVNYRDNPGLDQQGFVPFGRVTAGSGTLLKLNSSYGEPYPLGNGPSWRCVLEGGNAYLAKRYGGMDRVLVARPL